MEQSVPGHFERIHVEEHRRRDGVLRPVDVEAEAFVPDPLPVPFAIPELLDAAYEPLIAAERSLSLLEGTASRMVNPHILIGPFMRREAMLSSAIENTVATQQELALFEANPLAVERRDEVREVFNYVRALEHGLQSELPLSLRLIRELHGKLLEYVRGQDQQPGEFRQGQNYIGSRERGVAHARFVPPPPWLLGELLNNLEWYFHAESDLPRLVRLAISHYQFEAIHPFYDGNGRIGRLLITLGLCSQARLSKPLVYVSGYFEEHRDQYYDRLLAVSKKGAWYDWINFFLNAVASQADDARRRAVALLDLKDEYNDRVRQPRASALLPGLVDRLFGRPALSVRDVAEAMDVTSRAAARLVGKLESVGILREATGRAYGRLWIADGIIDVIHREIPEDPKQS